jgi:hypothetical protein
MSDERDPKLGERALLRARACIAWLPVVVAPAARCVIRVRRLFLPRAARYRLGP